MKTKCDLCGAKTTALKPSTNAAHWIKNPMECIDVWSCKLNQSLLQDSDQTGTYRDSK